LIQIKKFLIEIIDIQQNAEENQNWVIIMIKWSKDKLFNKEAEIIERI